MAEEALVQADTPTKPPAPNKGKSHLKPYEVADILRWHAQGLTQHQIAAKFTPPRAQSAISRIISQFGTDQTAEAKLILRGGAADMALNVVKRGKASDHVAALKGLNVLEEAELRDISVTINGVVLTGLGLAGQRQLSPPSDVVEGETVKNP